MSIRLYVENRFATEGSGRLKQQRKASKQRTNVRLLTCIILSYVCVYVHRHNYINVNMIIAPIYMYVQDCKVDNSFSIVAFSDVVCPIFGDNLKVFFSCNSWLYWGGTAPHSLWNKPFFQYPSFSNNFHQPIQHIHSLEKNLSIYMQN